MSNLLDGLNSEQKAAVEHASGPLLIVAGAGTGKTAVITKKIAHLIKQGLAKPDEILALTFTDKAAGEMEERADRLLPYGYVDLWISTFHSFCERILKDYGLEIGLPEFKLFSETKQWILLRKNISRFNLDYYRPLGNPTKFLHALLKHFSRAKDELISPEKYLEYAKNLKLDGDNAEIVADEKKKIIEAADAYHAYNQLLLEQGVLDFGDLINYALKLFKTRPKILDTFRAKFKYILVDEFQDTNFAQYELIKLLSAPKNNLTVVGDDDQSIYRFRGASMSNILTFNKDFPDAKKIVLTKNYRSGQKILDAAYAFIRMNDPNRLEAALGGGLSKKLESQTGAPGEIELIVEESLDGEVEIIFHKIQAIKSSNPDSSWDDFAILVRANESVKPFVRQAELSGVPYQVLTSRGLYSKKIIIEVIAYLKLLDNYRESSSMYRFLLVPVWGLKAEDAADIAYHARKKAISLYEACRHIETVSRDEGTVKKVKGLMAFLEKMREEAKVKKPSQLFLKFFTETGYLAHLTSLPDSVEKLNNFNYLKKFHNKIKEFEVENDGALARDFVEFLDLEMESGESGGLPASVDEGPEMIKVLTVHAAKGLEFKYVFIANLVHQRFPSVGRSEPIELPKDLIKEILPEGDIHLEEERRLFYVAMTRAKEKLFLACAKDYGGEREKKPSRFLYELGLISQEHKNTKTLKQKKEIIAEDKEERNEQIKYSMPKQFSYSQLKAYESCPYQYKLRYILNIPTEDKPQAAFGKSIHNTLQKFFTSIRDYAGKNQTTLFGKDAAESPFPPLEDLEKIYNEEWLGDWYDSNEEMRARKKEGWDALKAYYEKIKISPPKTLCVEQEFVMKFGGDSFRGAIDRIDKTASGKALIIDYKTSRAPKDGKLSFENKEQLLIYSLAAKEILNLPPEFLALNYILDGQEIKFLPEEKDLIKVRNRAIETIAAIKKTDFHATPDRDHTCRNCDYNKICEYRA